MSHVAAARRHLADGSWVWALADGSAMHMTVDGHWSYCDGQVRKRGYYQPRIGVAADSELALLELMAEVAS